MKAAISRTGKIKIPRSMLKKHGLVEGQTVHLVDYGGVITIHSMPDDPITYGVGLLRGEDSLSEMMIEEHCKDW